MVKYIIAVGDIHIRNVRRLDEYKKKLSAFIAKCKELVDEKGRDNVRIVIAGDVLHSKTDVSPEAYAMCAWLFRALEKIAVTIVCAGNHDISQNLNRLDPISTIVSISKFKDIHYIDKELGYESGCLEDENIVWCLYSSFDNFNKPNLDEVKIQSDGDKRYVGIFHGMLKNAKSDTGYKSENGFDASYFDGIDFGILGHVHRRQCIKNNGVPLVYCGSLIQQDFGENLSKHGFVVWDVENCTYEEVDLDDDEYGYYNFKIKSIEDIEEDNEELINL